MTGLVLLLLACAGLVVAVVALFLIPMVIGAFLEMLPYLIALGLLWWALT